MTLFEKKHIRHVLDSGIAIALEARMELGCTRHRNLHVGLLSASGDFAHTQPTGRE
jgi:hypothetical protein